MPDPAPPKPTLALTLALAGKRAIPNGDGDILAEGLAFAFHAVATRLGALADMTARKDDPLAARFVAGAPARLTLVTGLADGADQIAGQIFNEGDKPDNVSRVLGAVLPCARDAYVANSRIQDTERFEAQWADCEFVVELDGLMPPSPPPPALPDGEPSEPLKQDAEARRNRADAFSGQSEFLLRHADILVAVDNPRDAGRAGGTRETMQGALELGVPVILLRLGEPGLAVLRTRGDLDEPVMLPPGAAQLALSRLVDELIGAPGPDGEDDYVSALFKQFYADKAPSTNLLNAIWDWFDNSFKEGRGPFSYAFDEARKRLKTRPAPAPEKQPPPPTPYDPYKTRASALSTYYAGQYRGVFLAGYALAVFAVVAAVLSLALLPVVGEHAGPSNRGWWFLAFLSFVKVMVVVTIFWLAVYAHDRRLAHRAADYRYLTERLRAMAYLPKAGSPRSPANWSLPYTTRVVAQGLMDQLFVSIVRRANPLEALADGADGKVVRQKAEVAMKAIRDDWIAGQSVYHTRNHQKLEAMSRWLERLGRRVNLTVILIALADLLLMAAKALGLLPCDIEWTIEPWLTPTLISFAAILPALVASFNGVRFQSECTRLADRSKQMAGELSRLEARSWKIGFRRLRMTDALHLASDAARLMLDEVAEWSAIYGKEFVEMG